MPYHCTLSNPSERRCLALVYGTKDKLLVFPKRITNFGIETGSQIEMDFSSFCMRMNNNENAIEYIHYEAEEGFSFR
jgi:hypothetical protein